MTALNEKRSKRLAYIGLIFLTIVGAVVAIFLWVNDEKAPSNDATNLTRTNDGFRDEYNLAPNNHVFKEIDSEKAIELLESGDGVIMLGFPECPWCQTLVPHLNDAANETGIETIQYYNIREQREMNSRAYQKLVKELEPYLDKDENGQPRIYVPHVAVIRNGNVVGEYKIPLPKDGSNPTPDSYWNTETITASKAALRTELSKLNN